MMRPFPGLLQGPKISPSAPSGGTSRPRGVRSLARTSS